MQLENRVNKLNGKEWLKNSINYYQFDSFDLDNIQSRFKDYCFKERESGEVFTYASKYIVHNYDFTFQYLKKYAE